MARRFPAEGLSVGYLPQEPRLDPEKTVAGNVDEGVATQRELLKRYDELTRILSQDHSDLEATLEEQGELQDRIQAAGAWDLDSRVEMAMDALRLPPGRTDVSTLSGGEARRVALCRLLLQSPDLLLLDEPTNHLDAETVAWLERFLADYEGTVVAVTHDRYFLDNVAGWILGARPWCRYSVGRQLLVLAGTEAAATPGRGQAGSEAPAHAPAGARVDSDVAAGPDKPRARRV